MNILQPLGLALLILLPIIILLHMLRVRRQQLKMSSIYFWRQALRDIREQPKLQRPPLTLLLLLQLLVAAALVFGLSRLSVLGVLAGGDFQASHTIALLDVSSSMQATDLTPNRFGVARGRLEQLLGGLDPAASITLIRMGVTPRIMYSGDDVGLARVALNNVEPGGGSANLREAMRLAISLVKPDMRNRIVVYSDLSYANDQYDLRGLGQLPAAVEFVSIGGATANRAITLLSTRAVPGSTTRFQLFARVTNFSSENVTTTVRALADNLTLETREVRLNANTQRDLRWDLPVGTSRAEVRLNGDDSLPADDTAQVILPTQASRRLVLVSAQAETLRRALAAVPGAEVQVVAPKSYVPDAGAAVTVFDDFVPPTLPPGGAILINPPRNNPFRLEAEGALNNPKITRLQSNTRLLDAVDLTSVTIGQAQKIALPPWANEVIGSGEGSPLLFEGSLQNVPVAVFTFKLSDSNLASRVGFPILITNLINHLAPEGLPPTAEPGQPIILRTGPQVSAVTIQRPRGAAERFGNGLIVFANTEEAGRYQISEVPASGGPTRERFFTVNAGSDGESDLSRPREPRLTAAPPGQIAPGPTRGREIWPYLALAALGLLVVEWWVAHR